jgi:hypothetical protein
MEDHMVRIEGKLDKLIFKWKSVNTVLKINS